VTDTRETAGRWVLVIAPMMAAHRSGWTCDAITASPRPESRSGMRVEATEDAVAAEDRHLPAGADPS
jgi:hypothetical protein